MNSIKNENTGSSPLSTSATQVHVEDRAAVVTFKTVILSGPSERNLLKPPDSDQVQFTVKPSLGGRNFTKQLAQFCEICLLSFI